MNHQSLNTIKDAVIQLLENGLSDKLTYHNVSHTLYVLQQVEIIAKKENLNENDLMLLQVATLFHDSGFIKTPINHETESCNIARKYLREFGFTNEKIEIICGMIMATKIPQQPKNKLEMIIADADLEYLGTASYHEIASGLYKELKNFNNNLTSKDWLHIQIQFLENHYYFTPYCLLHKHPIKVANLSELKRIEATL
jgi:HD superfamily phosphodiesterase